MDILSRKKVENDTCSKVSLLNNEAKYCLILIIAFRNEFKTKFQRKKWPRVRSLRRMRTVKLGRDSK